MMIILTSNIFVGFLIVAFGEVGLKFLIMMTMAIEDEDSMALLPFGGSGFSVGSFMIRLPQCSGPHRPSNSFQLHLRL